MTDKEIYQATLRFSLMKVLFGLIGTALLLGMPVLAILLTISQDDTVQLIAAAVGLILGIIACAAIAHFVGYLYEAGQVAMVARAVDTGALPDDPFAAGKQAVKERFGTVAAYFALMAIIKGITSAITNAVNTVTSAFDKGGSNNPAAIVGAVISIVIAVVLEYLNYCSLGWVFIHKDQNAFKSTCDGAVIYFQNWKSLLINAAKIIGITLVSLLVIGGAFAALFYFVLNGAPHVVTAMAELDDALSLDAGTCFIVAVIVCAVVLWSPIHSAFIEPYILISVMRRYVEAGKTNPPKIDVYGKIAGLSKHFRKAMDKAESEGALPQGTAAAAEAQAAAQA